MEDWKVETFADVYSSIFDEYLSRVVASSLKEYEEYHEIRQELDGLYEKYPKVFNVFDNEQEADLSEEECKALIQIMILKKQIGGMELRSVYLRGCYDGVGYLKKAGIL